MEDRTVKASDLKIMMEFVGIPDFQINKMDELIKALPVNDGWISVETPPNIDNEKWYQCATDDDVFLTACTYTKYGFVSYGSAQEDGRVKYYRELPTPPNK